MPMAVYALGVRVCVWVYVSLIQAMFPLTHKVQTEMQTSPKCTAPRTFPKRTHLCNQLPDQDAQRINDNLEKKSLCPLTENGSLLEATLE